MLRIGASLLICCEVVWAASALPSSPEVNIQPSEYAFDLGIDRGSTGLWQTLKRLQTRASLLMITAHPDDEDGGLLTLESRGRGTRTMLLCLTRGEGGANVMSNDFFDALGLVRTEELLAANRYYGVQQYWSRAIDYGFSKTREEAFDKWGYDRILYDAVRVIRLTRPLVVVSVFIGEATDGHGNHRTTGQLAQEAFALAGDPNAFPDQIEAGLLPWKPLKMYGRVPRSLQEGNLNEKGLYNYATQKWEPAGYRNYIEDSWTPGALATTVEVQSGDYDPVLGRSYLQIAREGLGLQKCQMGGASVPPAGAFSVPYHRFASRVSAEDQEASMFDGIGVSLLGIADLAGEGDSGFLIRSLSEISSVVDNAVQEFSIQHPERTAPALVEGLELTNALIQEVNGSELPEQAKSELVFELSAKRVQFNTALSQAMGLSLTAFVAPEGGTRGPQRGPRGPQPTFRVAISGQEFDVSVLLTKRSDAPVEVSNVSLTVSDDEGWKIESDGNVPEVLSNNEPVTARFRVEVPASPTYTRPYFGRPDVAQAYHDILDSRYLNLSHRPYPLTAWATLKYEEVEVRIGQIVQTAERIPGLGTVQTPLVVGPPISVALSPQSGVARIGSDVFELGVTIHSNVKGPAEGTVRLRLPDSWRSVPSTAQFSTARDGEEDAVSFKVFPGALEEKVYEVTAIARYGDEEFSEGYKAVGYPGLRPYDLYRPATYLARGTDVQIAPDLRVGYVTGTGDSVPDSLESLGVRVAFLSEQDIASGNLDDYDLILLGIRAYAARPELKTHNRRLLQYVEEGGVVVVQYNTPEYDENFGPYPYKMTRSPEEVTDESSPMRILAPDNPVLNWPNKITQADFEGWIEQRGSKFLETWDPQYTALLETHDPGQDPQEGGMMYARYGRGVYVYCAYAFYRQLPEGVPGAYRLFANLLSLPSNPLIAAGSGGGE